MENFEELNKLIAKNIVYYRKKSKYTQEKLAELVNTSQPNISGYEQGKKSELSTLFNIAKALGVTLTDLMTETHNTTTVKFPISKFLGRTYYCYYVNNNNSGKVSNFELKIYGFIDSHHANAKIRFMSNSEWLQGKISLDEKFALIHIAIVEKSKYYTLSLNYYHDSVSEKYIGGIALLQSTNPLHSRPTLQICALSQNKIATNKQKELKEEFLLITKYKSKEEGEYKLEISNTVDKQYYVWLTDYNSWYNN